MQANSNRHKLSVNPDSRPSRFKVNLPEMRAEKEAQAGREKDTFSYFRNIITDTASSTGMNRDSFFKTKTGKGKKPDKNISSWINKQINKSRRLAFYWVFKLFLTSILAVYRFFKRLIYTLGWTFLFIVRFSYLVLFKSLKSLLPGSKAVADKIKFFLVKFLNQSRAKAKAGIIAKKDLKQAAKPAKREDIKKEESAPIYEEEARYEADMLAGQSRGYLKPVLAFTLILFIITLPFKAVNFFSGFNLDLKRGLVLGAAESAIEDMAAAAALISEADFNSARASFASAGNNFLSAKEELSDINNFLFTLAGLFPSQEIKLIGESKKILEAGELGAGIGSHLTAAVEALENWDKESSLDSRLGEAVKEAGSAAAQIAELNQALEGINEAALPSEYRGQFILIREKLKEFSAVFNKFIRLLEPAGVFLGARENKRYLLVFQNNSELRASGGFIGSYALIDVLNGQVRKVEAPGGGSYDMEAGMKIRVKAPEPLRLVNPLWHFWDANWWPDWPASAEKLAWFYEKSDGPTVDGVIAVTPTFMERFLELTGSVDMSEAYGEIINSENFWETVQTYSEQKPDVTNKPKKIIADMIDKLLEEQAERIKQAGILDIIKLIETCFKEKQILLYFNDENLENTAKDFGWAGEMLDSRWDYLQVVNTNIAGGKSSRVIEEEISLVTEVLAGGDIINTLKIKQTHTGAYNQEFTGVGNNNWMRIYVPCGSELLDASGFGSIDDSLFEEPEEDWLEDEFIASHEGRAVPGAGGTLVYSEFNKTVFANWLQIKPGETRTVTLKYRLPFKVAVDSQAGGSESQDSQLFPYALLAQKQPGAKASVFQSKLILSENFKPVWNYPKDLSLSNSGWLINDRLDSDKYWAVIMRFADNN